MTDALLPEYYAKTIKSWIDEELARCREEGDTEQRLLEPTYQGCILVNVIAEHVDEFLADKQLTQTLRPIFERRGLTGEKWFITMAGLVWR